MKGLAIWRSDVQRWVRLYPTQLHKVDSVVVDFACLLVGQEVKWQEGQ